MTSKATLNALKAELEKTVGTAQQALEQYLTASQSLDDWQRCVDAFQQLRGTFSMLEHKGAALLCEESVQLLQFLPVESPGKHESEFEALTQALVLLSKYLEFQEVGRAPYPEILLPTINRLRQSRRVSPLREGCFHTFAYKLKPQSPALDDLDANGIKLLRKYRHMFQAGLLHVLREERSNSALTYVALSLRRTHKLLADSTWAEFWALVAMAGEGIAHSQEGPLSPARRVWFSQVDRALRTVVQKGSAGLKTAPPKPLVQDCLYYIALTADAAPRLRVYQERFPTIRLQYTSRQLREQEQLMRGPGQSVLQSLSEALQEEFNNIKDTMDIAAAGDEQFSAYRLRDQLNQITDTLDMVGLTSPANVMRRMWEQVKSWPDNAAPRHGELMRIADSVLYAESALSRLNLTGHRLTSEDSQAGAHSAYLHQARVAVLDEMETGLSVCKRAISAFMDSNRDVLHLANVPSTLRGVYGALVFMDAPNGLSILQECIDFVDGLKAGKLEVSDSQLDAFADALSSLEFFLEGLLSGQQNQDVIRVAQASLDQLPKGE
ncbi:MAG: hypothetical protein LAT62_16035 [Natronospirillum sp.]|uniref:hypothetical protein n=1 Tax=Natronospirillum sp. TaxID=2812955 RepID=UPI0025EB32A0|nr:hypothetical protein [Natronospirillum sp.]MCH8553447.1 hypothetical protein [Natronospirillum sp.]